MNELEKQAAKEAIKPLVDLLHKLCGPSAEEWGENLGVFAKQRRIRNAVKAAQKTEKMLKDIGVQNPHSVSLRLFLPILENASIEEDEDLHSRWSALLANAAAGNSVHPSFVEIIKQLSPDDARLLDKFYDSLPEKPFRDRFVHLWGSQTTVAERDKLLESGYDPTESFKNLIRLGLVQTEYGLHGKNPIVPTAKRAESIKKYAELKVGYTLAEFADTFIEACRAPKNKKSQP